MQTGHSTTAHRRLSMNLGTNRRSCSGNRRCGRCLTMRIQPCTRMTEAPRHLWGLKSSCTRTEMTQPASWRRRSFSTTRSSTRDQTRSTIHTFHSGPILIWVNLPTTSLDAIHCCRSGTAITTDRMRSTVRTPRWWASSSCRGQPSPHPVTLRGCLTRVAG